MSVVTLVGAKPCLRSKHQLDGRRPVATALSSWAVLIKCPGRWQAARGRKASARAYHLASIKKGKVEGQQPALVNLTMPSPLCANAPSWPMLSSKPRWPRVSCAIRTTTTATRKALAISRQRRKMAAVGRRRAPFWIRRGGAPEMRLGLPVDIGNRPSDTGSETTWMRERRRKGPLSLLLLCTRAAGRSGRMWIGGSSKIALTAEVEPCPKSLVWFRLCRLRGMETAAPGRPRGESGATAVAQSRNSAERRS